MKRKKQFYIVQKKILARDVNEALSKENKGEITNVYISEDEQPKEETKIGFNN